ncbi:unnamed protein product, partial [Candidula unifasciata]
MENMSIPAAADGQCHYYLTKKRRYCRFQPKEGQQYCPEHACMMGIHGKRKRIPCPLNPKHNCYEDELEKHVNKCNVTKTQKVTQQARYYIQGINKASGVSQPGESLGNKKVCVKDLTSEELAALIARVDQLYQDHVDHIETSILEHPRLRDEYCGQEENDLMKALEDQAALRKELLQQASLIGQLEQQGLLNGGHCFIEMGAGKGKLSHWIQKASHDVIKNSYLLIDRSSVRYKMDCFHKQGGAESEFKRIKVDIEDLCLGLVDLVESSKSVVVVGKHLCGGATDMGIRCAVETLTVPKTWQHPSSSTSSGEQQSADINSTNLEQNETQAERERLERVPNTYQHSSFTKSESNKQLSADLNSEKIKPNGSQAEREETAFSEKHSCPDKVNQTCSTTESDSRVRTFARNMNVQGCSSSHCIQLPKGIMIALCCHHRCTWDTYIGQEFMAACGISPQEFDLLTRLSSWATCAKVT